MTLAAALLALIAVGALADVVRYDGHRLIRVRPETADQVRFLRDFEDNHFEYEVDFWTHVSRLLPVDIRVPPAVFNRTLELLNGHGIKVQVVQEDIQKLIDQVSQDDADRRQAQSSLGQDRKRAVASSIVGTFPRHADVNAWLLNLATTYPSIASVINIGKTYEGRDTYVLKLSTGSGLSASPKPKIFLEAGIHAREWLTVGTINYIIDQLTQSNGALLKQQPELAALDWYFLPVANPDGYEYTHTADRLWRKTRTRYTGTACVGADPNRNWGYQWRTSGTSSNPCDDTYGGPYSFSEKCVINERNFLSQLTNLKAFVSLHAFGQMWFVPYAYAIGARPADYNELRSVAVQATAALARVQGTQYSIGSPAELLSAASGGTYDWVKGQLNVKYSYTLELSPKSQNSGSGFIVSPSAIVPSGMEVFQALKVVARYAGM